MKYILLLSTLMLSFSGGISSAQAQVTSQQAEMCKALPKTAPKVNNPTHIWNVVWRNKVSLCSTLPKAAPEATPSTTQETPPKS